MNNKKIFTDIIDILKKFIDIIILFVIIVIFDLLYFVGINIPESIKLAIVFLAYFTINGLWRKEFINTSLIGIISFIFIIHSYGKHSIDHKQGSDFMIKGIIHIGGFFTLALGFNLLQKKLKRQIKDSELKYKNLFNSMKDGICLHEMDEQGDSKTFCEVNDAACEMLGYTREELLSMSPRDVIWEDEIEKFYEGFKFVEECGFYTQENTLRTKIGRKVPCEVTAHVFNSNDKNIVVSAARDISKRKEAEESRRRLDEVLQYERLRTEFFANISHELRTPLNVLLGSLQLMGLQINSEDTIDDKKLNKYMNVLMQNCNRLLRLVNNLIDITKIDSGYLDIDLKNGNIIKVVEDITLSVADYIENKDINLIFDTETEEKIMAFDGDKIERIILNLLSNAIKFTPSGGMIFVNIFDKGETMVISIKDTGIGIPEDKKKVIFERFRQADNMWSRKHEGSGIGLSLVKSLVEMHQGKISVESEYGHGSEFIIEMPVEVLDDEDFKYDGSTEDNIKESHIERINIEFSDIYS
ncbi:PAS domain-containing sensor histidine kinase [Wukongibacter baidiensis]|uniref:PAS domain-containing sensor histidine kinase n=1 Tax=Wukongibacter baidiensis TaxID=1723361 RepID=UPI003D7F8C0A